MRPLPLALCMALGAGLFLGCSRGSGPTAEDCSKACARVGEVEAAKVRAANFFKIHESEEQVEAAEEQMKKQFAQYDAEEKLGRFKLDEKMLQTLSPQRRGEVIRSNDLHEDQLVVLRKQARELARKRVEEAEAAVERNKAYQAKQLAEVAEGQVKCQPICLAGTKARAQCLQRVQVLADVELCGR